MAAGYLLVKVELGEDRRPSSALMEEWAETVRAMVGYGATAADVTDLVEFTNNGTPRMMKERLR